MVFFPRARSRSRMRCWTARSSLTGTTSWFEATAAELPFVLRCCHRRTYRGRDCQLPCQLRKRQLLAYDPSDLLLLELRGKEAATIRSPTMCFHPTTLR